MFSETGPITSCYLAVIVVFVVGSRSGRPGGSGSGSVVLTFAVVYSIESGEHCTQECTATVNPKLPEAQMPLRERSARMDAAETMSRTQAFETCVAWLRIFFVEGLRPCDTLNIHKP